LLAAEEERDGAWWRRSGARDCSGGGGAATHGLRWRKSLTAAHRLAEEERRHTEARAKSRMALGLGERRCVMRRKKKETADER
jgi:hypothetical protein